MSRRAAVLGSPVRHSLSPVLHRAAYAALGLSWSYDAIECDEAALPELLDEVTADESWAGLSLTMPLKRAVLPLLDEVSELAVAVGGANTVVLAGGRRVGHNTDVYGMVTALTEAGVSAPRAACVLGGGATAAAALAALRDLDLPAATLVVRDPARAGEAVQAADRLDVSVNVATLDRLDDVLPGCDLVVSTLPSGAADPYAKQVAGGGAAVFDVVYAPWPTPLATAVHEAGGRVVGGFPMLLHQAVRQVEFMTGRAPGPVAAMRAAGEAELAARG